MKRFLLIAVSVSLLGLSGAAFAGSPHNERDGRLHSKWDNSAYRGSSGDHERHDDRWRHHEREHWSRHDRDRYEHHHKHNRVVYVTPHNRYRQDVYFGVVLGPHGAFQYIQRW